MFNEIDETLNMLNQMLEKMGDHPSLIPNIAKVCSKLRDALVAEGFTRDEAIAIVKASGVFKNGK